MKKSLTIVVILLVSGLALTMPAPGAPKADEFGSVVKLIEQFYHVKHESIPLLARAGLKAATTAARIRGGEYGRLAEAGSVRIAFFEDQAFDSRGGIVGFKTSLNSTVGVTWSSLVQTVSPKDEEQTYIFVRNAGDHFNVLVVTIDRHDATVVQVNLKPDTLAQLLRDPNEMGKAITDDAAKDNN
jgi:hypothetical protein